MKKYVSIARDRMKYTSEAFFKKTFLNQKIHHSLGTVSRQLTSLNSNKNLRNLFFFKNEMSVF